MHSTSNIEDGYLGSGLILRRSIRKYGEKNFKREILEFCESREMLSKREKEIVTQQLINKKMCMNLVLGGEGGFKNKEHQIKAFTKGLETQNKLRETNLEWVKKRGNKISLARKEEYKLGKRKINIPSWVGKKHTEETKELMRNSHRGKGIKESNSQYGTMWITNEIENKKISNTDIIPKGYFKGRKINN